MRRSGFLRAGSRRRRMRIHPPLMILIHNPQGGVYSQPLPAGIAAGQDLPLAGPKTQAPLAKERSRCAAHAHVIFGGTIRNADRFPRTPYDSGIGTGNRHLWKLRNTMALLDFEKSHVFVVLHQNWGIGADP